MSEAVSLRDRLTSNAAKGVAGAALAVVLLALFFRGTDFAELGSILVQARASLVAMACLVMLSTYFIRAIRWQLLLSPVGAAGLWNCFLATVIGFAVNTVAGRLGEIVRPWVLARREGFSVAASFATILVERIMDLLAVLLLIGFWLVVGPVGTSGESSMRALKLGGLMGLAGALVTLAGMYLLARFPERSLSWIELFLRLLPGRFRAAVRDFVGNLAEGLKVLTDPASFAKSIGLSIGVWLVIALGFWLGARALGVAFDYGDTFLIIGFLTVGLAVPTPAGVGGYHYMCALGLTTLVGADLSAAKAVALLNHAVSVLPVTLLGILLLPRAGPGGGLRLWDMRKSMDAPTADRTPVSAGGGLESAGAAGAAQN